MSRNSFVARFADIYVHSPWVAERTFDNGLDGFRRRTGHDRKTEFAEALKQVNRISRFRLMAMAEAGQHA